MSLKQHWSSLCSEVPVAAVGVTRPSRGRKQKPRHTEEFCRDNGEVYEVGAEWSDPGICNLKTCRAGGVVEVRICPHPDVPDGCMLGQPDLAQSYPYCCPKAECSMRPRRDSSSSSSSSSSTSSSDAPDKYEDLDDDDCGDDGGGDMTMDFTMMGEDREEAKRKEAPSKAAGLYTTTTLDVAKRRHIGEHVKPPDIKGMKHLDKIDRIGKCSERRELSGNFHFVKEKSINELVGLGLQKQVESNESLKIQKEHCASKDVEEIGKEKVMGVKTDVSSEQHASTFKSREESSNLNNLDSAKSTQNESDPKPSDKSNCTRHEIVKGHDLDKDTGNGLQSGSSLSKVLTTLEDSNIVESVNKKEPQEISKMLAKENHHEVTEEFTRSEKTLSTKNDTELSEKMLRDNTKEDVLGTKTLQQQENWQGEKISHNSENVLKGLDVKHEELKTLEIKVNLEKELIYTDKTVDELENGGEKDGKRSIVEKNTALKENPTSNEKVTDKNILSGMDGEESKSNGFTESSCTELKESEVLVTEVNVISITESSSEPNKLPDSNTNLEKTVIYAQVNSLTMNLTSSEDKTQGGASEKPEVIVEISEHSRKIIHDEKTYTNNQENINPPKERQTYDSENIDNDLVSRDKSDSVTENNGQTDIDKTIGSPEETLEVRPEPVKELKADMNQFEDEEAKMKEAIMNLDEINKMTEDVIMNEGKLYCSEGMENMPPAMSNDDDEQMYKALGPNKEFEKVATELVDQSNLIQPHLDGGNTYCSEGLEEFYKHRDLQEENEQFDLKPAEDITPMINRLQEVSKFANELQQQGNNNGLLLDEEFEKYKAAVGNDNYIDENIFKRFEISPDQDTARSLSEDQLVVNKETEEMSNEFINTDTIQYGHSTITDSIQAQITEEVTQVEEHTGIFENDAPIETITESAGIAEIAPSSTDLMGEHLHTNIDIGDDILSYSQLQESEAVSGEGDFNFRMHEDFLTHSVDESHSNPMGMVSDGPMSGSADTDRFEPNLEQDEDDDLHDHEQLATEANT